MHIIISNVRVKESPDNIINKKNLFGHTLLYVASRNGNIKIVKLLVEMGANLTIRSTFKKGVEEGNLSVAARWGHCSIVKYLLDSTRPSMGDANSILRHEMVSAKIKLLVSEYIKANTLHMRCCNKVRQVFRKLCCLK